MLYAVYSGYNSQEFIYMHENTMSKFISINFCVQATVLFFFYFKEKEDYQK